MLHIRDCPWLAVASLLVIMHPTAAQTPSKPADPKAMELGVKRSQV
jgi:hypothetical protein